MQCSYNHIPIRLLSSARFEGDADLVLPHRYLATTGAVVSPESSVIRNLFAEVLATPQEVFPRAIEIATEIAENTSTVSTYLMRMMMWRNPGTAEETHLLDSEIMFQLYDKQDKAEGINSFLEKRPANFQGSVNRDMPDCVPWWTPVDVRKRKDAVLPKL
jgi:enoyl-CoA hydratase/carnithine racemase